MAIALKKRMCLSLSDALETQPVLVTDESFAALLDATPAAFVSVLFVAAHGCGLARLLWA